MASLNKVPPCRHANAKRCLGRHGVGVSGAANAVRAKKFPVHGPPNAVGAVHVYKLSLQYATASFIAIPLSREVTNYYQFLPIWRLAITLAIPEAVL